MDPLQYQMISSHNSELSPTAGYICLYKPEPAVRQIVCHEAERRPSTTAILVRPFTDRRSWEREVVSPGWSGSPFGLSHSGSSLKQSVSALLTSMAAKALVREGCRVVMEEGEGRQVSPGAVLEGEIHSFWFDHHSSVELHADVCLTLRQASDGYPLWIRDLPEDNTLPVWIGVGTARDTAFLDALKSLEQEFSALFEHEEFGSAVIRVANQPCHNHRRLGLCPSG